MKHTFRCNFPDGDYVEYVTGKMVLDDILNEFRNYLQGCGFAFKLTEDIVRIDSEEESQELSNYVYVVTMERWGSRENHSYVVGVCSTFEQAQELAELEEIHRGGKYERCIERFTVDKLPSKYDEEEII